MTPVHAINDSDEAILARLGYKQEFKRAFTPFEESGMHVFGLAFNIIGLLPSMSSVILFSMLYGGPVSMVWGWPLGTFFIMCIGLAMGELASSAPTSGGLYYLTYTLASPRCRNLLCWIVGYANTVGMITGIASLDWGLTIQMAAAANIGSNGRMIITSGQSYGIYVALILSQAVICSLWTRVLARLQTLYVMTNIFLCLVVIIALPAATPKELKNPASYVFGNFTNLSGWSDGFSFFFGLLTPLWTIAGYDSVIHMSEESSNAATAAPWGIVSSIGVAGILGWVINIELAFYMGPDLAGVVNTPVNQPMAQVFLNSFGRSWTLVVWSLVMLAQYMMCTTGVLVASRQSFALARDRALPFSKLLYQMNTYTGTPINAVIFDCVGALLIGLLALLGTEAVNAVFTTAVVAFYVAYIVPIASRFIFENNFKPGPFSLGILGAPIAAVAIAFMVFMLVIFCFPSNPNPLSSTMNYTSVVFGGVMFLAMAWYYFPVYGGVHWFRGPEFNVESVDMLVQDEMAEKASIKDDGLP